MIKHSMDAAHSEIGFTVRHMMFAKVRGQFERWSTALSYDASDPSKSTVTVEVETGSINTREPQRDAHLRTGDFFDAERFPKMVFRSKRVEGAGKGKYRLVGDLTIRDVSREVILDVEETGAGKDPWGNTRLGFAVRGSISRSEWGLKWNQALEAGGVLVSDKVDIDVQAQIIAAKPEAQPDPIPVREAGARAAAEEASPSVQRG